MEWKEALNAAELRGDAEAAAQAWEGLQAAQTGDTLVLEGDDVRATGWAEEGIAAAGLTHEEVKALEKELEKAYNKATYEFGEELVEDKPKRDGKGGRKVPSQKKSVEALIKKPLVGKIKGKERKYIVVAVQQKRKSKDNPVGYWQCLMVRSSHVQPGWFGQKYEDVEKKAGKRGLVMKADMVKKLIRVSAGRSSMNIDSSGESSDNGSDSDDSTRKKRGEEELECVSSSSSRSSSGESESEDEEEEDESVGGDGGGELNEVDGAAATVDGKGGGGTESSSNEESDSSDQESGNGDKAGPSEQQVRELMASDDPVKKLTGIEVAMARIRARKRVREQMN